MPEAQVNTRLRTLVMVIVFLAICSLVYAICRHISDPHIASLSVGHARVIDIKAEAEWEINRGIYYEVREGGRAVTSKTFFELDDGEASHAYTIVSAEQQGLVGVIEAGELVIIQDFQSGESWPRLRDSEMCYDPLVKAKWRGVFNRLKVENPKLQMPLDLEDRTWKKAAN